MPPKFVSDFMVALHKRLVDEKKVSEPTASKYLSNLTKLNDGKPFKTLAFLRKTDVIDSKLAALAPSTRIAYNATLTSVLSLYKATPGYKKAHEHYSKAMYDGAAERRSADPHAKSDTQEANWITWDKVLEIKADLAKKVTDFSSQKSITPEQFETLLQYVLVSLYTDVPPRRNLDYEAACIVPKVTEDAATDKNYLDLAGQRFVFNRFKTARKYGKQEEAIPDQLMDVIDVYLKFHPHMKKRLPKNACIRFLVKADGSPLNSANGITRLLNKAFGKRVGSSMLRHIYLSQKYGDSLKEMEADAEAMGHSVGQQRDYVKMEGSGGNTIELV